MSYEVLSGTMPEAVSLWAELTDFEKEIFSAKLLPEEDSQSNFPLDDPRAIAVFAALIVVPDYQQATQDRFLTLRNFFIQTHADQTVWAQIRTVIGVGRCYLELTVHDRTEFLEALRDAGYAVNTWMEKVGQRFHKYHRFDNARALTDHRFDPQLHFSNDRADEPEYGPNYFAAHWDAQSVYARHSSLISRIPAALSHAKNPATPEQVQKYLIRKKLWPVAQF